MRQGHPKELSMSGSNYRVLKWVGIFLAVLAAPFILYQLFVAFAVFRWERESESTVSPTNLFRSATFPFTNGLGHRIDFGATGGFEEWYRFEAGKDAQEWLIDQRRLQRIGKSEVPKRFWQ